MAGSVPSTVTPTDATPVASRQVLAGGVRCHVLEAGAGPPLLLLHGTAIDSATLSYGPSLPVLAARHRVLALDWPGYGRSERPTLNRSVDDQVDLLVAFLEVMDVERAHVAGFSMGGAIGLGLALRAPERVASLTMIGSYGLDAGLPVPLLPYLALRTPMVRPSVVWVLRRSRLLVRQVLTRVVFSNPQRVTRDLVADVHHQLRAPEAERTFVAWLRGELRPFSLGTTYADRLGDVAVPTLLLHGRDDRVVSWRKAQRAQRLLPDARLVVVPGCGHWVPREAPQVFENELLAFAAANDLVADARTRRRAGDG
jgi:pimeloyl-ACP methyl ester carboxylesterase